MWSQFKTRIVHLSSEYIRIKQSKVNSVCSIGQECDHFAFTLFLVNYEQKIQSIGSPLSHLGKGLWPIFIIGIIRVCSIRSIFDLERKISLRFVTFFQVLQ